MKIAFILLLLATGLVSGASYFYPQFLHPHSITETVLYDRTDSFLAQPNWRTLCEPLNAKTAEWNGVTMRFVPLSNVDLNPVQELRLSLRYALLSNPDERNREVDAFITSVSKTIDSITAHKKVLGQSSIYQTLLREANRLSASSSSEKYLVAYTDLLENTAAWSIYNEENRRQLEEEPDKVRAMFEAQLPPASLKGLQVYIIFQPRSEDENEGFKLMLKMYKDILESRGAVLHSSANLLIEAANNS